MNHKNGANTKINWDVCGITGMGLFRDKKLLLCDQVSVQRQTGTGLHVNDTSIVADTPPKSVGINLPGQVSYPPRKT